MKEKSSSNVKVLYLLHPNSAFCNTSAHRQVMKMEKGKKRALRKCAKRRRTREGPGLQSATRSPPAVRKNTPAVQKNTPAVQKNTPAVWCGSTWFIRGPTLPGRNPPAEGSAGDFQRPLSNPRRNPKPHRALEARFAEVRDELTPVRELNGFIKTRRHLTLIAPVRCNRIWHPVGCLCNRKGGLRPAAVPHGELRRRQRALSLSDVGIETCDEEIQRGRIAKPGNSSPNQQAKFPNTDIKSPNRGEHGEGGKEKNQPQGSRGDLRTRCQVRARQRTRMSVSAGTGGGLS